jgi:hypothetical protein
MKSGGVTGYLFLSVRATYISWRLIHETIAGKLLAMFGFPDATLSASDFRFKVSPGGRYALEGV